MKKFIIALLLCQMALSVELVLDLTTPNSFGTISGAVFQQGSTGSGTGNYVDFVQIQHNGSEQGYNTSYRPNQFNEGSSGNFNRDVQLGELAVTTYNGNQYLIFGLDVNERANEPLISLDEVQIYVSPTGNRTGYPNLGTLVYDMNGTVLLDYSLGHGSGWSDMTMLIPTDLITNYSLSDHLYLYSSFGNYHSGCENWTTSDGAEQWAINEDGPRYVIPEPSSALLVAMSAGFLGMFRPRRKKI
jgi:hypothetical protein